MKRQLPVLEYLQRMVGNRLEDFHTTHMRYPTAISRTLALRVTAVASGQATVEIDADPRIHGNQQGTVHGGLLCELADAAIGTAHSTVVAEGESFASIDLKLNFFRPVWNATLRAVARPVQTGRTVTYYTCEIFSDNGKLVATAASTVMTLRGGQAAGRVGVERDILFPCVALAGLTAAVWARGVHERVSEIRQRRIRPQDLATSGERARLLARTRSMDNFNNLLELPTLFYVLCIVLALTHEASRGFVIAAWVFVALRAAHSLIQATYNRVTHRFAAWVAGALWLYGMWAALALRLASA